MKKILYIHHGKGLGGAPLSLLYLIQNLDKTKYDPIVLFLHDSEVIDLYKKSGIKIAGIVGLEDFPHTKIYWYRWYHAKYFSRAVLDTLKTSFYVANRWLKKINPDVVHLNTSSLTAWAKVAKKNNIPVVMHVREPLSDGYFGVRRGFVRRRVGKYSDFIVPISQNDARPWAKNSKVSVVYNAVDQQKFDKNLDRNIFLQKYNLKKDDPRILFLGGLSKEKGTLVLFKIFEQVVTLLPDAKLIVAGYFNLKRVSMFSFKKFSPSQAYNSKVFKILKKIKNNIIFTGPINDVEFALASCDVMLNPFTVGHFSRPVIEAGFMAKPVIASKLPPLDELVVHGVTGYLIDTDDIGAWVEKVYALLTNKKLNEQLGKNAYDLCVKNFSVIDHVKKIENLYQTF